MIVTRGFRSRRHDSDPARLPPGQHVTTGFPLLSAGVLPQTPLALWSLTIRGAVENPVSWSLEEFRAPPREEITVDIHCFTKWSKLDTTWRGVSVDTLLAAMSTHAKCVMAYSDGGYATNLPREELLGGGVDRRRVRRSTSRSRTWWPGTTAVPHLYSWKSAKWVRGLELLMTDQPRFWETYGYQNYGDPWREQRYSGD